VDNVRLLTVIQKVKDTLSVQIAGRFFLTISKGFERLVAAFTVGAIKQKRSPRPVSETGTCG